MQDFKITLSDGKVVSGLHSLPPSTSTTTTAPKPLIVALHGGTYTAKYFDVDSTHTASIASNGLGVPFVAINRPSYDISTPVSIPEGSSYAEESGLWLHREVLPVVWTEFGAPRGCTCIVLHAHSMGTMPALIAAGLHATEESQKSYPFGGITLSGFGSQPGPPPPTGPPPDSDGPPPETIVFPPEVKDSIMLQEGHADPEIYKYTNELNHPMPAAEMASAMAVYLPRWREMAGAVQVPVMVGFAGNDLMWKGTEEHLHEFTAAFKRSERVDGSVVKGAPHNMEMSYWANGWYARCFGFALECAASFQQKNTSFQA